MTDPDHDHVHPLELDDHHPGHDHHDHHRPDRLRSAHSHEHGHGHDHGPITRQMDARALIITLILLSSFMVVEVVVAFTAHSVALLSDAGHMVADVGAIAGSFVAMRLASRPETGSHTYGMMRAEILAAAGNGITLVVVAALISFEAIERLIHPINVQGTALITVAAIGVVVNVLSAYTMSKANRASLNIKSAYTHILTDLWGFLGTVVAGIIIVTTGFHRADPIASLVVVALMLRGAVQLLRPATRILLEAAPDDIDLDEVRRHLLELPEVESVHDLHAWTLTSSLPILTAHIVVTDDCISSGESGRVLDHLQGCLAGHFDVVHSTLQFELAGHLGHESGAHS
jgi:cobalt-zinc-cadmium efflux system protein